jgi:glutamate formiminotransferase/formiminotetrahydrofolate cyclodeaminase
MLIECIPNFSEGRRPEVIEQIAKAITAAGGQVLDRHSDQDHNRSVITFVGDAAAVEGAAYAAIAKAAELIDLDQHHGEHPRIGATDVVPFVPLEGATIQDCIAIARRLAERVGTSLNIPVYLYEAAATRPDRVNLEDIRRGNYEGLKVEVTKNPDRKPDFGPSALGKAGATVIGARAPLIAFNVYLNTSDVIIARKIAQAIRHSSGGLRYIKGMGVLVEGLAQVSMNFTDFTKTPLARVVEMIRREANRYGVSIARSELVGLIPQAALVDAAQWYLQLDQFEPDQILESRLYKAGSQTESASDSFMNDLAAGTAAPGGGSAAAYAGTMAAALVGMVARLTIGKKKYAEVQPEMQSIAENADHLRSLLHAAVVEDANAYTQVMEAMKLPEGEDRDETLEAAMQHAAEVPLRVARDAVAIMALAAVVAQKGNVNAISDAGSAVHLGYAAMNGAALTVRINAEAATDREAAQAWLQELHGLETRATDISKQVRQTLKSRAGIGD